MDVLVAQEAVVDMEEERFAVVEEEPAAAVVDNEVIAVSGSAVVEEEIGVSSSSTRFALKSVSILIKEGKSKRRYKEIEEEKILISVSIQRKCLLILGFV